MVKLFVAISIIFSFISCKQTETKSTVKSVEQFNYPDTSGLRYIDTLKDVFVDCGMKYTYDSVDISEDNYLFLSTMTDDAIIKINNNVHLLRKDHTETVFKPGYYKVAFKDSLCKIVLDSMRRVKKYTKGSSVYASRMSLTMGDFKRTYNVHGVSGCWK